MLTLNKVNSGGANLLPAMALPDLVARRALLSEDEIAACLREVPGWSRAGNAIERTWTFRDFSEALAFINKVGALAEAMNHHPDIANSWATVRLTLTTHDKGGLTNLDFDLAKKINSSRPSRGDGRWTKRRGPGRRGPRRMPRTPRRARILG